MKGHLMIKILDPPAQPAVSVNDLKTYLRISHDQADEILMQALTAAQENLELKLNLKFITQRIWATCAGRPVMQGSNKMKQIYRGAVDKMIAIPIAPVQKIYAAWAIKKGQERELDLTTLQQVQEGERCQIRANLQPHEVLKIEAKVGFGLNPADVPGSLRMAILMLAQSYYRGGEGLNLDALKELLLPFMKRGV